MNPNEQVFLLPLPPSVNVLYRNVSGRGRVKTKEYLAWELEAGTRLRLQRPVLIKGPIRVVVEAVKPDKRRRDLCNLEKALSDLLVKMGVIEDDSLINYIQMEWVSSDLAGLSVAISPYTGKV